MKQIITTEPMGKLFDSPLQILEKAKREKLRLEHAIEQNDWEKICDGVFNFAVTVYHIKDWVSEYEPALSHTVSQAVKNSDALSACRDLCNGSKHAQLNLEHRSNKDTPPITVDLGASVTSANVLSSPPKALSSLIGEPPTDKWTLKIQLVNGKRVAFLGLAGEAIQHWEAFFSKHSLGSKRYSTW